MMIFFKAKESLFNDSASEVYSTLYEIFRGNQSILVVVIVVVRANQAFQFMECATKAEPDDLNFAFYPGCIAGD